MEWIVELYGEDYWFVRLMIQRGIALIYLIAFLNVLNQFRPLVGEQGLLPIFRFLKQRTFRDAPSIFHWYYSDRFLGFIAGSGVCLSLIILSGLLGRSPIWISIIVWFLLWAFYLSVVNTGQIFYGYGWESMLLEAGFYAIFLGPSYLGTPALVVWMFRWMVFRVEFGAGLIKMRGDPCWKDLSCLNYHHETQPLPGSLSWHFHQLPGLFHKVETFFNHLVQLVVIWGLFAPQPVASFAAALIILSQVYLIISGNYSWLNWLTIILSFSGFSDYVFEQIFTIAAPNVLPSSFIWQTFIILLSLTVALLSIRPILNMLSSRQQMNVSFNSLHLVNTYGAFGNVTKKRYEIILEGTLENDINRYTEWKEYLFKGKPGAPRKRPSQISPYHLRLDWQMWFAALHPHQKPVWLFQLIKRLLKNDPDVITLLKESPFREYPPEYIRARLYEYRYTCPAEKKATGQWWKRTLKTEYLRPLSLGDFDNL